MTPEQFCYWLQGYFELQPSGSGSICAAQARVIKEHLQLTFEKVTTLSAEDVNLVPIDREFPLEVQQKSPDAADTDPAPALPAENAPPSPQAVDPMLVIRLDAIEKRLNVMGREVCRCRSENVRYC